MYSLLFCAAMLCSPGDSQQLQAQPCFAPAAIANKQFPLPTIPFAYCSTPGSLPNFYNTRDGGSCYNYSFDFDGDGSTDHVYVWAIGHRSVHSYNNAVAYEVTDNAGVTLYRGTHYVGADIANLQVGIVRVPNVGTSVYQLIVAYWEASTPVPTDVIKMDWFSMAPSGLSYTKTDLIYACPATHIDAQHISLDCSDSSTFVVSWEDQGVGIFLKGFDALTGFSPLATVPSTTSAARLPDVALSQQVGGAANKNVHLAYLETAGATPTILKYDIDFASLWTIPTFTLEDVETLAVPFGANFYDFQMDIDAPDHYTGAQPDWAYAYYNNDASKIKVRVCDRAGAPVYNTYVVNDGSLATSPIPPFSYLPNITNAGNAFPTLSYLPNSLGMTIGWYTNYDPSGAAYPIPNNPLFDYTGDAQRYVSVVLDKTGFLRTPAYNRVDMNYATNMPNTDFCIAYPKINFTKNNEGPKLFALFQSHNEVDIWNYNWGGTPFLGKYAEWPLGYLTPPASPADVNSDLNYFMSGYFIYPDISIFLSQKMVDWYPFSLPGPLFKKAGDNVLSEEVKALNISPNPFSDKDLLLINGGDAKERYTVHFSSVEGKVLLHKEGTVAELNAALRMLQGQNLAAGLYFINIAQGKENLQLFKIVKH